MEGIKKAVGALMFTLTVVVILLTVTMFAIVGLNVYMRYVVNRSLGWVDELSRFLFIWMSFLGAALAFEKGQHVGLDYVIDRIRNPKVRLGMFLLGDALIMIVLVILFRQGIAMTRAATNLSPALSIHMKYVFVSVPIGVGVMVMLNVLKVVDHLALAVKGDSLGLVVEEESEAQQVLKEGIEKRHEERVEEKQSHRDGGE